MAISRITGQDARGTGASGATATYPGATTAGNLLVACVMGNIGTDTLAISGWTKGVHIETGTNNSAIFYKLADGTETAVSMTGSNTACKIHLYEYTGNANPIVLDGTNTATSASGTSTTGASITTTNASNLIVASAEFSQVVTSPAATAPFNARQSDASSIRLFDADQVVSATGTYACSFSWTTTAVARNCIIAFQAAKPALAGTVAAVSAETGTITALMAASGSTDAVSANSGTATLVAATSGTVAGISANSGTATLLAAASGSVAGISGQSGTASAILGVAGSADAVSGTSGSAGLLVAVSGVVAAVSGAAGAFGKLVALSGVVEAVSGIAGTITALLQAAGNVAAISAVRGLFQRQIPHQVADVDRLTIVPLENRVVDVAAENRVTTVPAENRYQEA